MPDELAAELLDVMDLAIEHPERAGILLAFGSAQTLVRHKRPAPENAFEQWLIERWLTQIRAPGASESAEYQYLLAEWERSR